MLAYKYDKTTKEYLGTQQCQLDPLETEIAGEEVYLLPANCTFEEPTITEGYTNVFEDGEWVQYEDHRGESYWLPDDDYQTPARIMDELGELPESATTVQPTKPLSIYKAEKRAEINAIRDEKEMEPLNNFDVDVKSAIRILFVQNQLLRNGGTIDWTMADNTEENVDTADMNAIVDAIVEQSNNVHNIANYLKAQIEAATTVEEVEAIEWIEAIPEE